MGPIINKYIYKPKKKKKIYIYIYSLLFLVSRVDIAPKVPKVCLLGTSINVWWHNVVPPSVESPGGRGGEAPALNE